MMPKERILAAFEHESTDKVPIHHLGFSADAASKILRRETYVGGGIQQWREATSLSEGSAAHQEFLIRSVKDAFDLAEATDQDMLRLQYWRLPIKPTRKIDDFTFLYGDSEKWHIKRFIKGTELFRTVEEYPSKQKMAISSRFNDIEKELSERELWLENYRPDPRDFEETRYLIETFGKDYIVQVQGEGDFGIGLSTEDPIWLLAMVSRPDLASRYFDIQVEIIKRKLKYLAEAGVKVLRGGADIATNDGPCFPPQVFHELMLPKLKQITDLCHKYGVYYMFSSDGNLWPIADELFGESGVDGYYEVDRRAGMDLHKLRERFPHLVLVGNISSHTLHVGSREETKAETLSCLREAKRSRGIIVGVSNYIVPGTPKENIETMISTLRQNR